MAFDRYSAPLAYQVEELGVSSTDRLDLGHSRRGYKLQRAFWLTNAIH